MAIEIVVPDSAWSEQQITLGGETYNIVFKFNNRDSSWRFDLFDLDQNEIISGIKIMPNQNLYERYKNTYPELPSGALICFKSKTSDINPLGRSNLGVSETYNLIWLSDDEVTEYNLNGIIQF